MDKPNKECLSHELTENDFQDYQTNSLPQNDVTKKKCAEIQRIRNGDKRRGKHISHKANDNKG